MRDLIKLTRPLNLLIIGITMVLMRHGVIEGNLIRGLKALLLYLGDGTDIDRLALPPWFGAQMPVPLFTLLVLSTVLIAAGGNVINDYFDTRIDRINKPGEVIVGRKVERRKAMLAHLVLSAIGLLCGLFVAWRTGMIQLVSIPAFAIAALWSYSTVLKRQLIAGNVLVALLTALVPLTVGLYEIPLLQRAFSEPRELSIGGDIVQIVPVLDELWFWILGFSAFAFLATLVRELQKDMADVPGDRAAGCRTIPIVWGMQWSKFLVIGYILVISIGVFLVSIILPADRLVTWYFSLCVIGPLLISAGFTYHARSRKEHILAGTMMKLAMVMAVASSLLIPYLN